MADVIRQFFCRDHGSNSVQLSPMVGSETQPNDLGITGIQVFTSATTPPAHFWGAATTCCVIEVIFRHKS